MFLKLRYIGFVLLFTALAAVLTLAAAQAQTLETAAPAEVHFDLAPGISLDNVAIGSDHSLVFQGRADNDIGSCLPASILVDGEREPWWPVLRCVTVDDAGRWTVRIPSDDGGSAAAIHFSLSR
jgi:hypothetical protein